MIYFICGQDDFRIRQRLAQLRSGLLQSDPKLEMQTRSAAHLTVAEFMDLIMSQSLLTTSRLVVLFQPIAEGSAELREALTTVLSRPLPDGVVLVVVEPEPDQRTKLFKLLNKSIVESYPSLKLSEVRRWLSQQAQTHSVKLEPAATDLLTEVFAGDLWRLSSELTKLATFANGQPIDQKMVEQLTPRSLTDNIFTAIEALANKDLSRANQLINRQLLLGMAEQQLLSMIAYQFRNIITVRMWLDQGVRMVDLPTKTKLHPYVVKKTIGLAGQFTLGQLSRVFYLLQRIDVAIKTGLVPGRVGVDILTAQIANL